MNSPFRTQQEPRRVPRVWRCFRPGITFLPRLTQVSKIARPWGTRPAHIRRFERGALQLEIDQQMSLLEGPVDQALFAPPPRGWDPTLDCSVHRRGIEISTPMPPPGKAGTTIVDVVVFIQVTAEGTVKSAQIQSSPRPDLNDEALKTVYTWKFLPWLCNNQSTPSQGEMTVHFQGR